MEWKHPAFLWALPALFALAALCALVLRRPPRRGQIAFPMWLVAGATESAGRARRYLPSGFFAAAIAFIIVGAARPVVLWPSPTDTPVVLIIDVSRSMEENDVLPSRIEATRTAAVDFINGLPRSTKVALVSFGSMVTVVETLTGDKTRVRASIQNLHTQLRTQLGPGLLEGVRVVTGETTPSSGGVDPARPRAIAILLSDGRASDGVPPLVAAEEARQRGVRVHTVGVATTKDPTKLRSGYFGVLDDETLQAIADATGGRYYNAGSAGRLREIYRELARTIGWEKQPTEVTAIAALVALCLLVASLGLRYVVYPIH
jgi:Ca-activated chloride channel family protein